MTVDNKLVLDEVNKISTNIDQYKDQVSTLENKFIEFQAKSGRIGGIGETSAPGIEKTIHDWVTANHGIIKDSPRGINQNYTIKVAANMLTSTHLTGSVFTSSLTRMPSFGRPQFHLRDIIAVFPFETGSVQYPRETLPSGEGSFQRQTEGAAKAQIDYDLTMIDLTLNYLAGITTVSRQMLQDMKFLAQWLSTKLTEDFLTAEDKEYFTTLALLSATGVTSETLTVMKIYDYILQIETAGYYPTHILVRPATWKSIVSTQPASAEFSHPFGMKISDTGMVTIAGIPVLKHNNVRAGKCLIGDFSKVGIAQASGLELRQSEDTGDNFSKNLVSYRLEARCDLMSFAPSAFVEGAI